MSNRSTTARRFIEGIAQSAGLDPAIIDRPGTSLAATEGRAGSKMCVHYQLGEHSIVWHDPALTEYLVSFAHSEVSIGAGEWQAVLVDRGWEFMGQGVMRTLPAAIKVFPPSPEGLVTRQFDWSDDADLAIMQALIDVSSEHDLDEAEIDIDDLDDLAYGVFDDVGAVVAYASTRAWDMAPNFGDIGVLTRADARGRGLGLVVVGAVIDHLQNDGVDPLYRHDPDNIGSSKLSASLGFELVTMVSAARAPAN